jgi:predicted nucleotide-binding protein/prolyl-tRNA editing enzyme YbaK/EbsC (Cys-tRNA(Pro) deacylase)
MANAACPPMRVVSTVDNLGQSVQDERVPRVFVGASSEAEMYEQLVRDVLEHAGVESIPWRQSFRPGEYGLDSLDRIAREADGAILIASSDDKTWYRGLESFSPRDNILFELGYFLRAFGRRRTAIVQVYDKAGATPRFPTDLAGLTTMRFDEGMNINNRTQVGNWANHMRESFRPLHPNVGEVARILCEEYPNINRDWDDAIMDLILTPFLLSLRTALRGELLLTPGQYYTSLDNEISQAGPGTEILAVSTISSQIWSNDKDQQNYFTRNIDAAARGATIRRLFVLPEDLNAGLESIIRLQDLSGIQVRIADPRHAPLFNALDDIVLFVRSGATPRIIGYVALPAFNNPGRLRGGKVLLDEDECQHQRRAFESSWAWSMRPHELDSWHRISGKRPPGATMAAAWLGRPVISCEDAASARGIPLCNELKTLIVETSAGLIAAHIPGDRTLSLRAVKEVLETEQASLSSPDNLRSLGLTPGTVSAILDPVWSLPHLIDRAVLGLEFVATNNKTTTGYFRFDPQILITASSYTLADISIPAE